MRCATKALPSNVVREQLACDPDYLIDITKLVFAPLCMKGAISYPCCRSTPIRDDPHYYVCVCQRDNHQFHSYPMLIYLSLASYPSYCVFIDRSSQYARTFLVATRMIFLRLFKQIIKCLCTCSDSYGCDQSVINFADQSS